MSLYILDTDHVSLFQQKHPLVTRRVSKTKPEEIAVTIVTVQEQMRGWLNVIQRYRNTEKLIWAYQGLEAAIAYFNTIKVINFDADAYEIYRQLVTQKIRIGTQDLRIAAVALSVNGIVVTRNQRDFSQVPDLKLEDWTIRN